MPGFDGFIKRELDAEIEAAIAEHCRVHALDPLDAVKHFPVLVRRQLLKRFLAHAELFRQTLEVPGDIVELGVFRGFDLMTWANLLEAWSIGNRTKTVYGFDNWVGFERLSPQDGGDDLATERRVGGYSPRAFREQLLGAIEIFDRDRFVPQKPRVTLIDGDISVTVPRFVTEHPGVRLSLVHFDCDLYEPTIRALAALWPHVTRGGLVIFDEYAIKEWPGESAAVDEFFADKPEVVLRTLPWTNAPAAYAVRP